MATLCDAQPDAIHVPSEIMDDAKASSSSRQFPLCGPEKIVFCLDVSSELEKVKFKLNDGEKLDSLARLKKVLRIFVNLKSSFSFGKLHEYGLMLLGDEPMWRLELTPGPAAFLSALRELDLHNLGSTSSCDLNKVFDEIDPVVNGCPPPGSGSEASEYTIRVVIVYCRSKCIPTISADYEAIMNLRLNSRFFCDVVYVHLYPENEEDPVNKIYSLLTLLESPTWSVSEVGPNTTKLHNTFAELLKHPQIRQIRKTIPGTPVDPPPPPGFAAGGGMIQFSQSNSDGVLEVDRPVDLIDVEGKQPNGVSTRRKKKVESEVVDLAGGSGDDNSSSPPLMDSKDDNARLTSRRLRDRTDAAGDRQQLMDVEEDDEDDFKLPEVTSTNNSDLIKFC